MATLVGTQGNFQDAVKELIELDYDAVEAYEAAINRLESQEYITKLREFKADHEKHIKNFTEHLRQQNVGSIPDGPSAKQLKRPQRNKIPSCNAHKEMILKAGVDERNSKNNRVERVVLHQIPLFA